MNSIGLLLLLVASLITCNKQVDKEEGTTKDESFTSAYKTIRVTKNIPYRVGDSDAWKLDLAMPANFDSELRPALVIIHGGGWRFGSKSDDVYQKMMVTYAQKGYVTINVDYRLTSEAEFPACIKDVKCAVRWLRTHAEELNVDPNRIGSYSHSAGAHLSIMLAMVPDTANLEGDGGWDEYSSRVQVAGAGSPPTELGRDMPMAIKKWWSIGYIAADHVPMFLIQGSEDKIVLPTRTQDFVDKMKAAGNPNLEYLEMEGDHGIAYNGQLKDTDPALEKFFDKYLHPQQNSKNNK
ncbi:alpha/beta hydrolase [Aestuariibaculum sediminum]|uniref:Alpha/beta hydrolase n=1 Tax=Aestuariibaculum sediminum TaxID=2770637 RepID=A0A8J6UH82_9FLAO|nr:alpha/beta hydrolase [Aestuariibaculum sediminum]MBD0832546.1 alpha/beta hydrolase [Aestuariibaculum sediminum]